MADIPTYTLTDSRYAVESLVELVEFAFFTALSDLTDEGMEIDVGPVDGGGMGKHQGRHALVTALVDRLVFDHDLVIYPAPKTHDVREVS